MRKTDKELQTFINIQLKNNHGDVALLADQLSQSVPTIEHWSQGKNLAHPAVAKPLIKLLKELVVEFELALRLKNNWMEAPAVCFETLTFGELKVGQRFISLPVPGDNHGHGGLKIRHYIWTKTCLKVTETTLGLSYGIPHGSAIDSRGISSDIPHSMPVIIVE